MRGIRWRHIEICNICVQLILTISRIMKGCMASCQIKHKMSLDIEISEDFVHLIYENKYSLP